MSGVPQVKTHVSRQDGRGNMFYFGVPRDSAGPPCRLSSRVLWRPLAVHILGREGDATVFAAARGSTV